MLIKESGQETSVFIKFLLTFLIRRFSKRFRLMCEPIRLSGLSHLAVVNSATDSVFSRSIFRMHVASSFFFDCPVKRCTVSVQYEITNAWRDAPGVARLARHVSRDPPGRETRFVSQCRLNKHCICKRVAV